jgi:putative DNA-invertase from lambdoid prophage Rac
MPKSCQPGWSANGTGRGELMVRVCAYLRVSTKGQCEDNQLPDIQALAKSRSWEITDYYKERESAWTAGHQHELKRLKDELRTGKRKYDKLIIWSIDRLSREGSPKLFSIISLLNDYGCQVVSVKEPFIEGNELTRDLLITLFAWVAKFESDRRSQRIKAGVARKATKENWKPGRQKGAVDKEKRDRTGYLMRYVDKRRQSNILPDVLELVTEAKTGDIDAG